MNIKAKTKGGRLVTIIAFVAKYHQTFAVTIDILGRLSDYKLEDLTVLDK